MNGRWLGIVGAGLVFGTAFADDLRPLKSAAPEGLGPAALSYLSHGVIGTAFAPGSASPDLFVQGRGKTTGLYLFRWLRNTPEGVPVFAPPQKIESPFDGKGAILQTADGVVHGLWLDAKKVVATEFDREALAFRQTGVVELTGLPTSPQSLAVFLRTDGSLDLVLELNGETIAARDAETNASSPNWRPFDAAGISTAGVRYRCLWGAHLAGLLEGPVTDVRRISATEREVIFGMMQLTPVKFGSSRGLMAGSRLGNFFYYPLMGATGLELGKKVLAADEQGNALRHPSISASVCAYPTEKNGVSNLVAAGEGALYFYAFTGRFTASGAPMFRAPVPVLQTEADLYTGTLPTPSVVDWDGDGVEDMVVGNSEGFVLFFRNVGTAADPKFLPGERIQAGSRDIQIQAGYSGSVQGTGESRWGYVSPNVVDWTGDGLPDIVMGDITGNYTVYLNRGTKTAPKLEAARPLFCDGLNLHGMWRSRAAVGRLGDRTALILVDGEDHFHLYWKIDDYHVEDGGKLTTEDGAVIVTSADPGGGTGRCKLDLFDADGDGKLDLVIGTGRRSAIPNKERGYPLPVLGKRTLGTPLFMKNVGTNEKPVFAAAAPYSHRQHGLVQPGGSHESGAVGTTLGGGSFNLLAGSETGRLYLLRGTNLSLMSPAEAALKYWNRPNPLPQ